MSEVLGFHHSHEAWRALEVSFSHRSKTRELQLKDELQLMQRGSQSIAEFSRTFKGLSDQLAAIGRPIDDTDKVHWYLRALGPDYKIFSTTMMSQLPLPSFAEIVPKALSHEIFELLVSHSSSNSAYFVQQTSKATGNKKVKHRSSTSYTPFANSKSSSTSSECVSNSYNVSSSDSLPSPSFSNSPCLSCSDIPHLSSTPSPGSQAPLSMDSLSDSAAPDSTIPPLVSSSPHVTTSSHPMITREGVFPQIKITPRVDRRVVTAEEEASPHQSNRRAASDNRKSWSLSPEKEDRFYTTRGSLGFDQVHPKKVVSDCVKHWFQDTLKEAIADDSSMQDLVGQMYYSGYGVPRDAQKVISWIFGVCFSFWVWSSF
ncbi:hypothetical protein HHK36_002001 [Tetracentron sinense]|uniref:Uncharacterized protein n=1 Tax=Tetracentron sinense TaxID=13715 RepID=A0A835DSK6_TETSI|nr:hypothetical protein HHK36_002001 [Tetracentron sinense]